MTLYWAYGSNLNVEAMKRRCPKAKPLGSFHLDNARLVFRGVADVAYAEGESCPGGLWRITKECERALDMYEGVEHGLYEKKYLRARIAKTGKETNILVYQMTKDGIMPPGDHYYRIIQQGYRDFNLNLEYLRWALEMAWDDKAPTPSLRKRRKHRGDNLTRIGLLPQDAEQGA